MRTWIEINLTAFSHNIKTIKNILPENQKLGIVVKANAYGHGLMPVSSFLNNLSEVYWLFTAGLKEAIKLRQNGITKPICVMSYIDENPFLALAHDIHLPVTNVTTAYTLEKIGKKYNKQFDIHIKIDTGLSRLGIATDQAPQAIAQIATLAHLKIQSIFTHMADNKNEKPEYSNYQQEQFNHVVAQTKKILPTESFLTHCNASSSLLMDTNKSHDIVRIGTSAYGLYKSASQEKVFISAGINLHPILTWKSKIIEVKKLPAGTPVSYGGTYITDKQTILAMVPIGYWDGYPARLSNKAVVYVKNKPAPVVGSITMNIIAVDITTIQNATVNDEVTLIGTDPGITISELAHKAGNINIELLAQLNPEIERKTTYQNSTSIMNAQNNAVSLQKS